MTCESKKCKGEKNFCYVCEAALTEEDHFDHFLDKNPMQQRCAGSDPELFEEELKRRK